MVLICVGLHICYNRIIQKVVYYKTLKLSFKHLLVSETRDNKGGIASNRKS